MSDITQWPNLVTMFFDQADAKGEAPFLWAKKDGTYHAQTWREVAADVSALARGLRTLGIKKGDRVILVSENRPEWLTADVGIMAAGAVTTPAYTTNTIDDHKYIIEHSGAKGAIVSTRKLAERFLPAAHQASNLDFVICLEDPQVSQSLSFDVVTWADILNKGQHEHWNVIEEAATMARTDLSCIIYTSGTGGAPKGVMLSHGAILHNCNGAKDALLELGLANEVFLSFLPLSHSYEHMAGQFFPISVAAQIYYAEGIETLGTNMVEVRPTIMTAVPRLYETLHGRITTGVKKAGGAKEKLFNRALELGTKRYHDPNSLTFGEKITNVLLDKLVRKKVKGRFGGRLKALVSGGAPLNPDIGMFFTALGLTLLQGYGQTESAPLISVNRPSKIKLHTVGPEVLDTEVKIADDGEILCRGELVMQGYWRNDEATAATIIDGWLHTGDVGLIDSDGYLQITDRKKDIIVNSGGDNISPQRIEGILCLEREIGQSMVYGDKRSHLVALLVPDSDWLKEWAAENGKQADLAALVDDADLHKALSLAVDRVNKEVSNIDRIRRFILARDDFTIENGQMTPSMKVKRFVLKQIYGDQLEKLYG